MSTKIFSGFRVSTIDLDQLHGIVERVRPRLERRAQNQYARFIETVAGDDDTKLPEAFHLWHKLRAEMKRTGQRMPAVDTEFKVVFIPQFRSCLGIVYTEHDEWFRRVWLTQPEIEEFSYWNNTDRDPRVGDDEWEFRRREWDKVNIPAMDGFAIEVTDPNGPFKVPPRLAKRFKAAHAATTGL